MVNGGSIKVDKVGTLNNPADIGTKNLRGTLRDDHVSALCVLPAGGEELSNKDAQALKDRVERAQDRGDPHAFGQKGNSPGEASQGSYGVNNDGRTQYWQKMTNVTASAVSGLKKTLRWAIPRNGRLRQRTTSGTQNIPSGERE